jgi:hypothetical protein
MSEYCATGSSGGILAGSAPGISLDLCKLKEIYVYELKAKMV